MSSCVKCSAVDNWRFIVSYCVKCGYRPDAIVAASWSFDVRREVASLNRRASNTRHGYAYRDARKGWHADMLSSRRNARVPIASSRRRVTLTRLYGKGQRELDRDNLIGGLKPAVDAMVTAALLIGDSPAQAEIHYAQLRSLDFGLRVLLEELA